MLCLFFCQTHRSTTLVLFVDLTNEFSKKIRLAPNGVFLKKTPNLMFILHAEQPVVLSSVSTLA